MNPFLEAERARKRESLLAATEAELGKIAAACARARAPLRGKDKIAVRLDRVLSRRKVAKHFVTDVGEDSFSYHRDQDSIAAEAVLDGIYVLRTSIAAGDLDSGQVVTSYKALAQVERAPAAARPGRHGRLAAQRFRTPGRRSKPKPGSSSSWRPARACPTSTDPARHPRGGPGQQADRKIPASPGTANRRGA